MASIFSQRLRGVSSGLQTNGLSTIYGAMLGMFILLATTLLLEIATQLSDNQFMEAARVAWNPYGVSSSFLVAYVVLLFYFSRAHFLGVETETERRSREATIAAAALLVSCSQFCLLSPLVLTVRDDFARTVSWLGVVLLIVSAVVAVIGWLFVLNSGRYNVSD